MTHAPHFSLAAELDATQTWDEHEDGHHDPADPAETGAGTEAEDGFTSGYADEADPEEADLSTGELDLVERHELRRVAGLRTELEDITEVEYRQLRLERVVLVGVWTSRSVEDAENSMAEMVLLAETAGSEVLDAIYQRRQNPDPATYIGRGKVEGLAEVGITVEAVEPDRAVA